MRVRLFTPILGLSVFVSSLLVPALPSMARLWKPTPDQLAADYVSLTHIKGTEGRVFINWMAAPVISSPGLKQVLEKYVVLSIVHTRQAVGGALTWDDIQGVQASDGNGQPLKEVPSDSRSPMLIGMFATSEATMRQSTQGAGKIYWGVWEAGSVGACLKGKLVVNYDGEAYSFDTPLPSCGKP
ncbi:MAG TPA: hypothetical protein VH189_08870 [Rhizomicrobium sp.]|nr:hypothetical protein [Rhizomicrobium sp.]